MIIDRTNSKIIIKDSNTIVKTLKNPDKNKPLDDVWFEKYNYLQNNNEAFVKVYKTNGFDTIEMENLDILSTVDELFCFNKNPKQENINKDLICDIVYAMQSTWNDMIKYSKTLSFDSFFLHGDVTLQNVVVTKDLKVKLIDVDSIAENDYKLSAKHIRKYYFSQLDLMGKIQDYYYDANMFQNRYV
tara:strand:+ start:168 stop:728 length:561 start_codon:yes stop_codon:yes gene_type:complete